MRTLLILSALVLGASASAEAPASLGGHSAALQLAQPPDRGETADSSAGRVCRDRIEAVRESRGLPKLTRDGAVPDEPLLIAAVDKRIGGCSVMVMRNNTSDVRPLPQYRDGPAKLTPLGQ